jgi:hypothetical protein
VKKVEHSPRDFAPNHWSGDDIITFPDISDGSEVLFILFDELDGSSDDE